MKKLPYIVMTVLLVLALALTGCSMTGPGEAEKTPETSQDAPTPAETADAEETAEDPAPAGEKKVIGFAQSRMNHPYRVAAVDRFKLAVAEANLPWEVVVCDGQNDTAKQTSDVEDLITQGVDLIVMSPITADPLAPVCKKVMEAGIPLILLDRTITTDDYTVFIGGDNTLIGRAIAEDIVARANGENVKVVEMQGTLGASATTDRHEGFMAVIDQNANIEVISDTSAEYDRAKGMSLMEDILQTETDIFAVATHSDSMAMGAMTALQAQGLTDVLVYGADGTKEAFDEIEKGTITGSCWYPTGAAEAVEIAQKIFAGETIEREYLLDVPLVTKDNLADYRDVQI